MEDEKPKRKRKREKTKGLPSDPDALEKWQNLPQTSPSREALPPATKGGWTFFGRYLFPRGLFLLIAALILLGLVAGVVSRLG
jgi:hypothetical protein